MQIDEIMKNGEKRPITIILNSGLYGTFKEIVDRKGSTYSFTVTQLLKEYILNNVEELNEENEQI